MRSVLGHARGIALAPAEKPVDAEFDDVDVLGDVSMEDPAAHRRNREGDVAAPQAIEVVLEEGRPVGGERPCHPSARGPAGAGLRAIEGIAPATLVAVEAMILVPGPGAPALPVDHPPLP